jgi:hypothetical protein
MSDMNHLTGEVYPDAVLNIDRVPASVFQLKRRHDKSPSQLDLGPEFQRELVWNTRQKSELIESILMGIPLPLFYVKEDEEGVYIIVDGKQRLSTMFDFIDNKFALGSLKILKEYKGRYFKNLPPAEQSRIEDFALTLHVIKPPTSDQVTFDLFDRVNRSGTRLNNQEMRNALYQGNVTRILKILAATEEFKMAVGGEDLSKRMKDRYMILRFLAFYLWKSGKSIDPETNEPLQYKSNLEDFLSKSMRYVNKLNDDELQHLDFENMFKATMVTCCALLGKDCFRLPMKEGRSSRRPLNMALFETISYFVSQLHAYWTNREDAIKNQYQELLHDSLFVDALTRSVDSKRQIDNRFNIVTHAIERVKTC